MLTDKPIPGIFLSVSDTSGLGDTLRSESVPQRKRLNKKWAYIKGFWNVFISRQGLAEQKVGLYKGFLEYVHTRDGDA